DDVAGDFAHHINLQSTGAAFEAIFFHLHLDPAAFLDCAAKRNHDLQVGETHFFAYLADGAALKREAGLIAWMVVPTRAPETDHRVFLGRLVGFAADEIGISIGFEIA